MAWLLATSLAFAVGRVEWKSKTLKEADNKSWKVDVAIHLPKPPDLPTMPMKFEFQPVVYYERTMLDGDKLVERKVPLENRQALIESVDVGFLDPGSGKIEKRTKFVFKVTRGHGYEAGEYQVKIRDGRSGDMIGTPARLIFQGENEIIDRRAMVFAGGEKKKKKSAEETTDPSASSKDGDSASAPSEPAESTESEGAAAASETPPPSAEAEAPSTEPEGTVKEKPGGCGCRAAGTQTRAAWWLLAGASALGALRRRRSAQRAASAT
jgi:MYXO-CTERM domain-containing protein